MVTKSVKGQLVRELAKAARITITEADFIYDVLMDLFVTKLENNEMVLLNGVGRLFLTNTKSFKSNLTSVSIPKHKRICFKPNTRFARKIRVTTREHSIT